MSRSNLQSALKLEHRRSFAKTYLHHALEAEMTLPDKPTSQNQRYRRTTAGEVLARKIKSKRGDVLTKEKLPHTDHVTAQVTKSLTK